MKLKYHTKIENVETMVMIKCLDCHDCTDAFYLTYAGRPKDFGDWEFNRYCFNCREKNINAGGNREMCFVLS